jgi:hypothetical protein
MTAVEFSLERVRELLALAGSMTESSQARDVKASKMLFHLGRCEQAVNAVHAFSDDWKWSAAADLALQGKMFELSGTITEIFDRAWRMKQRLKPPPEVIGKSEEHALVEQVELFIATRVLDLIRRVFPIITLGCAVAGILAMMLATSSYPMPAPDTGLWLAWAALLAVVAGSMFVFFSMNKSRVISLLQGTTPGYFSLTSSFALQFLFFAVLPILTMLGAQYPHEMNSVVSWATGIFGRSH